MPAGRTLLRLGVAAASTVAALLVCEALLRWTAPIGDPLVIHNPNLELVLHPNPEWMPEMVSPARFSTDGHGFRVSRPIDYAAKPPGTFRVFLIGGSTTESFYIDDARTFGAILERRLDEVLRPRGRRAEVINAGRGGTGSADHFYVAWQVTAYEPDLIVYLMGVNEMIPYLRTRFEPEATELKAVLRTWVFRSQLARRLYQVVRQQTAIGQVVRDDTGASLARDRETRRRARLVPLPEDARRVPPTYGRNIARLLALHRRQQLPALFMTQPALWHESMPPELEARLTFSYQGVQYAPADLARLMDAYNDVLRAAVAGEPLAHLVDLARLLPSDGSVFYDEVHFTDTAQARIADVLFAAVLKANVLE